MSKNRNQCWALLCLVIVLASEFWNSNAAAQFPPKCDADKSCVGNALTIAVTKGKGAQYVDVDTSYRLLALDTAITFEAWIKPELQAGKHVFLAGVWGPSEDHNDEWVIALDGTTITFELSAGGTFLGSADNTKAAASVPDLYTKGWRHLAATWDSKSMTAKLYLDGVLIVSGANTQYPLTALHPPENRALPFQIGSTNALYNDTTANRAFKGGIDEVRLWSRALSQREIQCQRLLSLAGNEKNLELYYRCNDNEFSQNLCDATGHNILGRMRSGAQCTLSDRTMPASFGVMPNIVNGTLTCTNDTSYTFTIIDTAFCGDRVGFVMQGINADLFSVSPSSLQLQQGIAKTITVRLSTDIIGPIAAELVIYNTNRCGDPVRIPIRLTRQTELSYDRGVFDLDTLIVGCIQETFHEQTLKICNNSGRTIRIDSIDILNDRFTWRGTGGPVTLPLFLPSGNCRTISVRMDAGDTSVTLRDTLRIYSDERCPGSGIFPISGRIQQALAIWSASGKNIDSMRFEAVCPGQISNSKVYQYRSLILGDTVFIDSIKFSTPEFFGFRFGFPIKLIPKTAYFPTPVRFKPNGPIAYQGFLTITGRYRGCTIQKKIYLSGRGISVDLTFDKSLIGFGSVTVGKSGQQTVTVKNVGLDERRMSGYLKVGDVFDFVAGKRFAIGSGASQIVTLSFRPREAITYYDTLCFFDEECYGTICIPVEGSGVFNSLKFDPPFVEISDIVGCQCGRGSVKVTNIAGQSVNLMGDAMPDATGKLKLISRPAAGTSISPGQSIDYTVEYCPNDLNQDRADKAYITMNFANGETYELLVRANSVAPKVYVTPLTTYGTVEVGWQRTDSILIENISSVPVDISTIIAPASFTLVSTNPPLPVTLAPRDSLWAIVTFAPKSAGVKDGDMRVEISGPCPLAYNARLTATGKVEQLQIPISFVNYGLIKPCQCVDREIPIPNLSNLIDLTIDSVWIDGSGVTPLAPSVFQWRSKQGGNVLPYIVPPQKSDTLVVSFCPNIPATKANQAKTDTLHILAHGGGWSSEYKTLLSGRRELNFQPNRTLVTFPATRVDTGAAPQTVSYTVPAYNVNPSGDSVVITRVSFVPDQNVFSARAATGVPLPWVIKRGQKFDILVDFYPRQPKDYEARMYVHTSFPCNSDDTTVLVRGSGFAPAFGLDAAFDTSRIGRDTLRVTTCDTLEVPIMLTRAIPQDVIDMFFRISYDTNSLRFLDLSSAYTPRAVGYDSTDGAAHLHLIDARNVQAGLVAIARFVVIGGAAQFPIGLDEINFDSDSLVFFKIVSGVDVGFVMIDQPIITISKLLEFDTVNIKDCRDQRVTVTNPGAIPIRFDSLGGLPKWHEIIAASRPLPAVLNPGDSLQLTVRFCPLDEAEFSDSLWAMSSDPCPIVDGGTLHSVGFAPPYPFRMLLDSSLTVMDTLRGAIADTVVMPIYLDRAIPQTPIDLRYSLIYNRRALKVIQVTSPYATPVVGNLPSGIEITLPHCENMLSGPMAFVKFVISIPDSIVSQMSLIPGPSTSDSVFWVKPQPTGDSSVVVVDPTCNISRLDFTGTSATFALPTPNPTTGLVTMRFSYAEDLPASLVLYDSRGARVASLLDARPITTGGSYELRADLRTLPSGAYLIRFDAGQFHAVERILLAH